MDRSLEHYPANARRIWYLALTVIATITLYLRIIDTGIGRAAGAGAFPSLPVQYGYGLILANILGALAALVGSLSDCIGRANLLVFGLLVTGVCTLSMAFATSLWPFLLLYWGLGFADGIMITVTVALVRDFTPVLATCAMSRTMRLPTQSARI